MQFRKKTDTARSEQVQTQQRILMARAYLVYVLVCVFALVILGKVFVIQFFTGDQWKVKVEKLTTDLREIPATRGNIYASDGSLLATSIPIYEIRMDMQADGLTDEVFNAEVDSLSFYLSQLFRDKSKQEFKRELINARHAGKRYHLVRKGVNYNEVKAAKKFPIFRRGRYRGGVLFEKRTVRQRPFGELAARTIGYEREGVQPVGLEGAYNTALRGRSGSRYEKRLAGGVWMPVGEGNEINPEDGADIISAIDVNIQDVATSALREQLIAHNADHGCVVLMEVQTGFVRAIANLTRKGENIYREDYNYAVGEATEPGSTFKLPALMAALEDGRISISDSVDTRNGTYRFFDRIMRDSNDKGYGKVTVRTAFEKSSNVGISRIIYDSYKDDPSQFIARLYNMGLSEPLGLEIAGEGKPKIKTPKDKSWSGVSLPWMSIGYEVLQTPLQILAFYNAIANNGVMVRPQFIESITKKGKEIKKVKPQVLRSAVCSKQTLDAVKQLLEGVVAEEGTAGNLRNPYYKIAGKTGTAQIANAMYGYKYDQEVSYQASFVGYFPADNPRYSCIVVVNGPSNSVYYGNQVAGPIFKEVADKIYAMNFDLHKAPDPANTLAAISIPVSKNGNQADLKKVFETLNVPVEDESGDSEWVVTTTRPDTVHLNRLRIINGLVPNVEGMGLQDAVYILEKKGFSVRINGGKGVVKHQSISPGSVMTQQRIITLDLS